MRKPEYFYWIIDEEDLVSNYLTTWHNLLPQNYFSSRSEISESFAKAINNQRAKGLQNDKFLVKAKSRKFNWRALETQGVNQNGMYDPSGLTEPIQLLKKDIVDIRRVRTPEKIVLPEVQDVLTLTEDIYFAEYVRDLRIVPPYGEVLNLVDDLFLFSTTSYAELIAFNYGTLVSPLSAEIIQYMISNYECLGFSEQARDETGFFGSLREKCTHISFQIREGQRIRVAGSCIYFVNRSTWEQYKSDFESHRQYPNQGNTIHS